MYFYCEWLSMKGKGFTLIEVLIVMFIIGIMSMVTAINVNVPNYSKFQNKVEILSQSLGMISDEAIYSSSLISCNLGKTSINCRRYKSDDWQDINLKQLLSMGWPEDIRVNQVLINGKLINEKQSINFNPSGDNDSLAIEVTDGTFSSWIYGDFTGRYWISN